MFPAWLAFLRNFTIARAVEGFAILYWYYAQLYRLGDGKRRRPKPSASSPPTRSRRHPPAASPENANKRTRRRKRPTFRPSRTRRRIAISSPAMIAEAQIGRILDRYAEIEARMSSDGAGASFAKLAKEYADLGPRRRQGEGSLRHARADQQLTAMSADPDAGHARDGGRRTRRAEAPLAGRRTRTLDPDAAEGLGRFRSARSSKSAPAPAATKRRSSPATCSRCTAATRSCRAGSSRS